MLRLVILVRQRGEHSVGRAGRSRRRTPSSSHAEVAIAAETGQTADSPRHYVWGGLTSEIATCALDTIDEAAGLAEAGLNRIGSDAPLCFGVSPNTTACGYFHRKLVSHEPVFGPRMTIADDFQERHRLGQSKITSQVRAHVAEPLERNAASVAQDRGSTRAIGLRVLRFPH